ncbi:hypothetical protein BDV93DRAFT_556908 [Ceratobasidium sp. AG-I]|nr:hypothetical protein BDV93DRAFT_556908 [Ceratobasidium sp. AG-I]
MPDIGWGSTQDSPVRKYFKLFVVDFKDNSAKAEQYKMNNSILQSFNNVIRNCEKKAEVYSSDILLGFFLNAIFGAYESGSMMMGWDKNAVAKQVSFHANQTKAFEHCATSCFDPSKRHTDKFGSYHTSTVPPYSHDVFERSHTITLFHDEEGYSVDGYNDDARMSESGSVGTGVSDKIMERAQEGPKDSIHAVPTNPEPASHASSLPLEHEFPVAVWARISEIKNFVGITYCKGKGKALCPTPASAPSFLMPHTFLTFPSLVAVLRMSGRSFRGNSAPAHRSWPLKGQSRTRTDSRTPKCRISAAFLHFAGMLALSKIPAILIPQTPSQLDG